MPFPRNDLTLAEVAERERLVREIDLSLHMRVTVKNGIYKRLRELCSRTASGNVNYPFLRVPEPQDAA